MAYPSNISSPDRQITIIILLPHKHKNVLSNKYKKIMALPQKKQNHLIINNRIKAFILIILVMMSRKLSPSWSSCTAMQFFLLRIRDSSLSNNLNKSMHYIKKNNQYSLRLDWILKSCLNYQQNSFLSFIHKTTEKS